MWDYTLISAQISRGSAGVRNLTPATIVLCLSALSKMDAESFWNLTAAQYDTVENWIDTAYNELISEYSCPSGGDMQVCTLSYETGEGIDGVAITADVERTVPLNVEYDPFGIVTLSGSNAITLDSGKYWVMGRVSVYDTGRGKLWLTGPQDTRYLQGINRDNEDHNITIQGLIDVDGLTALYLTILASSTGSFGRNWDQDVNEIFAQISFMRVGDYEA